MNNKIFFWYTNINAFSDENYNYLLGLLPLRIRLDVQKHKFIKDQKMMLGGRLLVNHFYSQKDILFSLDELNYTEKGKPYLSDNRFFNISHSANYIVVVFSTSELGVDIEEIKKININQFTEVLHKNEISTIESSDESIREFYNVWTRKEAYFKANGYGITNNDLSNVDCLANSIVDNQKWFLKSFDLIKGYKVAICYQDQESQIEFKEFDLNNYNTY